jgi:SOCE-associated regulatory factor of calcium homoeostasis
MSILGVILYSFLKSCFGGDRPSVRQDNGRQPPGTGPGGGYNRGWWPGDNDNHDNHPPPPPYSKTAQPPVGVFGEGGWRPGFWTGAAMGGIANHLFNRNRRREPEPLGRAGQYDWEQRFNPLNRPAQPAYQRPRNRFFDDNDRGEGSSSGLGAMRSSTGLGGTNVR